MVHEICSVDRKKKKKERKKNARETGHIRFANGCVRKKQKEEETSRKQDPAAAPAG